MRGGKRGLHQLVADQANRTPDTIAGTFGESSLTYRELDRRANHLARRLVAHGVGPDVPVALALERSLDLPVAVLAVLKAGGAYVPIDPNYPAERVAFLLADCRAAALVTQPGAIERLPPHSLPILYVDSVADDGPAVDAVTTPDHLAYIIYTSGSTGTPKGVAMRRGALCNLIAWQLQNTTAVPGDVTLQFASLSFDVSFQEIFSTLAGGGTLAMIAEELRHDPPALLRFLAERRVVRLFVPPVVLHGLAEAAESGVMPSSLREVICAAKRSRITAAVVAFFRRLPGCTLHNHYGPSETHVVTAHTLAGSPDDWPVLPPIGTPLPYVRIHIDERDELLLGGDCLARGYWHRPDLTAERFVPDPSTPGEMIYRTGDLGAPQWRRAFRLSRPGGRANQDSWVSRRAGRGRSRAAPAWECQRRRGRCSRADSR